MNEFYPSINIAVSSMLSWQSEHIELEDLKAKKATLERFVERAEDLCHCIDRAVDDESLGYKFSWRLMDASDIIWQKKKLAEDGIDSISDAIGAWETLDNELAFLFNDVRKEVKF